MNAFNDVCPSLTVTALVYDDLQTSSLNFSMRSQVPSLAFNNLQNLKQNEMVVYVVFTLPTDYHGRSMFFHKSITSLSRVFEAMRSLRRLTCSAEK